MSNNLPSGLTDALDSKLSHEFGKHRLTGLAGGLVVDEQNPFMVIEVGIIG